MEDDDIYEDLPQFDHSKILEKLQTSNKELDEKNSKLTEELNSLKGKYDDLLGKFKAVSKNISTVIKTARSEIKRKDSRIAELNKEILNFRAKGRCPRLKVGRLIQDRRKHDLEVEERRRKGNVGRPSSGGQLRKIESPEDSVRESGSSRVTRKEKEPLRANRREYEASRVSQQENELPTVTQKENESLKMCQKETESSEAPSPENVPGAVKQSPKITGERDGLRSESSNTIQENVHSGSEAAQRKEVGKTLESCKFKTFDSEKNMKSKENEDSKEQKEMADDKNAPQNEDAAVIPRAPQVNIPTLYSHRMYKKIYNVSPLKSMCSNLEHNLLANSISHQSPIKVGSETITNFVEKISEISQSHSVSSGTIKSDNPLHSINSLLQSSCGVKTKSDAMVRTENEVSLPVNTSLNTDTGTGPKILKEIKGTESNIFNQILPVDKDVPNTSQNCAENAFASCSNVEDKLLTATAQNIPMSEIKSILSHFNLNTSKFDNCPQSEAVESRKMTGVETPSADTAKVSKFCPPNGPIDMNKTLDKLSSYGSRLLSKHQKTRFPPISSQWTEMPLKAPIAGCSSRALSNEDDAPGTNQSYVKETDGAEKGDDVIEALFGSPLKWTENSSDETVQKLNLPPSAFEDSCSAQIENVKFKRISTSESMSSSRKTVTEVIVSKSDNNFSTTTIESRISIQKVLEPPRRPFEELNNPKSEILTYSPLKVDTIDSCDIPSFTVATLSGSLKSLRTSPVSCYKYQDSILGQFDDTTQLVSALARGPAKISPIHTPVKISDIAPKENSCSPCQESSVMENKTEKNAEVATFKTDQVLAFSSTLDPPIETPFEDTCFLKNNNVDTSVEASTSVSLSLSKAPVISKKTSPNMTTLGIIPLTGSPGRIISTGKLEKKTILLDEPINILRPRRKAREPKNSAKRPKVTKNEKPSELSEVTPATTEQESTIRGLSSSLKDSPFVSSEIVNTKINSSVNCVFDCHEESLPRDDPQDNAILKRPSQQRSADDSPERTSPHRYRPNESAISALPSNLTSPHFSPQRESLKTSSYDDLGCDMDLSGRSSSPKSSNTNVCQRKDSSDTSPRRGNGSPEKVRRDSHERMFKENIISGSFLNSVPTRNKSPSYKTSEMPSYGDREKNPRCSPVNISIDQEGRISHENVTLKKGSAEIPSHQLSACSTKEIIDDSCERRPPRSRHPNENRIPKLSHNGACPPHDSSNKKSRTTPSDDRGKASHCSRLQCDVVLSEGRSSRKSSYENVCQRKGSSDVSPRRIGPSSPEKENIISGPSLNRKPHRQESLSYRTSELPSNSDSERIPHLSSLNVSVDYLEAKSSRESSQENAVPRKGSTEVSPPHQGAGSSKERSVDSPERSSHCRHRCEVIISTASGNRTSREILSRCSPLNFDIDHSKGRSSRERSNENVCPRKVSSNVPPRRQGMGSAEMARSDSLEGRLHPNISVASGPPLNHVSSRQEPSTYSTTEVPSYGPRERISRRSPVMIGMTRPEGRSPYERSREMISQRKGSSEASPRTQSPTDRRRDDPQERSPRDKSLRYHSLKNVLLRSTRSPPNQRLIPQDTPSYGASATSSGGYLESLSRYLPRSDLSRQNVSPPGKYRERSFREGPRRSPSGNKEEGLRVNRDGYNKNGQKTYYDKYGKKKVTFRTLSPTFFSKKEFTSPVPKYDFKSYKESIESFRRPLKSVKHYHKRTSSERSGDSFKRPVVFDRLRKSNCLFRETSVERRILKATRHRSKTQTPVKHIKKAKVIGDDPQISADIVQESSPFKHPSVCKPQPVPRIIRDSKRKLLSASTTDVVSVKSCESNPLPKTEPCMEWVLHPISFSLNQPSTSVEADCNSPLSPPDENSQLNAPLQPKVVTNPPQPKVVTNPPQPNVVANPPQPKVIANPPQPKVVAYSPQPKVVANPPQPKVIANPPQPKVVAYSPQPKVVTNPPQPKVVTNPPQPKVVTNPPQSKVVTYPLPSQASRGPQGAPQSSSPIVRISRKRPVKLGVSETSTHCCKNIKEY